METRMKNWSDMAQCVVIVTVSFVEHLVPRTVGMALDAFEVLEQGSNDR